MTEQKVDAESKAYTKRRNVYTRLGNFDTLAINELAFYQFLARREDAHGFPQIQSLVCDGASFVYEINSVGESLKSLYGKTSLDDRVRIAGEVFRQGLERICQMQSWGFIHGDISPGNVIWDGKTVCFIDFEATTPMLGGRAPLAQSTFPAPESYTSAASEIWCLAWVIIYWLTGSCASRYVKDRDDDNRKWVSRVFGGNLDAVIINEYIKKCPDYREVLAGMTEIEPKHRTSLKTLCEKFGVVYRKPGQAFDAKCSPKMEEFATAYRFPGYGGVLEKIERSTDNIIVSVIVAGAIASGGADYTVEEISSDPVSDNVMDVLAFLAECSYDVWSIVGKMNGDDNDVEMNGA